MMYNNPKISVIMSVYNGEKYLREAIDSILFQTFIDFEFIIINDGSVDKSLEIIQSYDDKRIIIINNEKNIGLTFSLNKALRQASGEYIARQDADDISLPNRFEEQLEYLEKNPDVVLLGTSVFKIDENGEIIGKIIQLENPGKELSKSNQFVHGTVLLKKEIIDRFDGYDELFKYSQDYELWLRITKYYNVRNLSKILFKQRVHRDNIRLKNIQEPPLYHLLAKKKIKNELNGRVFKIIKTKGIKCLHHYLNKSEKIYLYKTIAIMHLRNNDLKLAREEYKKIFKLNPFDIKNNINFFLSYSGSRVRLKSHKIFETIINYFNKLKH